MDSYRDLHIVGEVKEEEFEERLKKALGENYECALKVFKTYGRKWSGDVTHALLHAIENGQVENVLAELKEHSKKYFTKRKPEIRVGLGGNHSRVDPTTTMFICLTEREYPFDSKN